MTIRLAGELRAIPLIGAVGAGATSLFAMGCCLAPSVLVTALTAADLGALLSLDMGVTVPILYALVGLSIASIGWTCQRAGRWSPLALAVTGTVALLIPFHEALDVGLFYGLVIGGQSSLVAAAALSGWTRRRVHYEKC